MAIEIKKQGYLIKHNMIKETKEIELDGINYYIFPHDEGEDKFYTLSDLPDGWVFHELDD